MLLNKLLLLLLSVLNVWSDSRRGARGKGLCVCVGGGGVEGWRGAVCGGVEGWRGAVCGGGGWRGGEEVGEGAVEGGGGAVGGGERLWV